VRRDASLANKCLRVFASATRRDISSVYGFEDIRKMNDGFDSRRDLLEYDQGDYLRNYFDMVGKENNRSGREELKVLVGALSRVELGRPSGEDFEYIAQSFLSLAGDALTASKFENMFGVSDDVMRLVA
jgi:hypothetical protein